MLIMLYEPQCPDRCPLLAFDNPVVVLTPHCAVEHADIMFFVLVYACVRQARFLIPPELENCIVHKRAVEDTDAY